MQRSARRNLSHVPKGGARPRGQSCGGLLRTIQLRDVVGHVQGPHEGEVTGRRGQQVVLLVAGRVWQAAPRGGRISIVSHHVEQRGMAGRAGRREGQGWNSGQIQWVRG